MRSIIPMKQWREASADRNKIDWKAPEVKEWLRQKAEAGLSASQIAYDLTMEWNTCGVNVTRNMILGAMHRDGLTGSGKPRRVKGQSMIKPKKPRAPRAPAVMTRAQRFAVRVANAKRSALDKQVESDRVPFDQGDPNIVARILAANFSESSKPHDKQLISIMQLNDKRCRWPFECDDGTHKYCGDDVVTRLDGGRSSYCAYHSRMGGAGYAFAQTRVRNQRADQRPNYR